MKCIKCNNQMELMTWVNNTEELMKFADIKVYTYTCGNKDCGYIELSSKIY